SVGEYYGVFKKYSNTSFGYVGPLKDGQKPCAPNCSPTNTDAVHLGDELWVQWYQRNDSNMLNTTFARFHWGAYVSTPAAGSTTVLVAQCPMSAVPAPSDSVGRHIWFYNENTGIIPGQYLITGRSADGCSLTVDHSPSPDGPGGMYPNYSQAF